MNGLIQYFVFGLSIIAAHGLPTQTRRQVFNPNLLMDRYMNMRTDQGTYGSYHPNDIEDDVAKYFENGGGQVNSNNQWGLFIYNPNAAMPQYMGQLQEPGNLAPGLQGAQGTEDHSNQNSGETIQVGFNPSELNRQLMQSAHTPGYSSLNAKQDGSGSNTMGFNPDAVNRQLMMSALSQSQQSQVLSSASHSSSADPSSNTTSGMQQSGMPYVASGTQHVGYNADQVNAGLYSSIGYNPNAVNSATFNMPSFSASGQHTSSNTGNAAAHGGNNGGSPAAAGTQNGQIATGNAAGANGQLSQTNAANVQQSGATMAGAAQATGIGGMGSYNPFSKGGTSASSGVQQNGANIRPSTRVNQNGLPPGVPAGMKLSQTEAVDPIANGIGGLGQ